MIEIAKCEEKQNGKKGLREEKNVLIQIERNPLVPITIPKYQPVEKLVEQSSLRRDEKTGQPTNQPKKKGIQTRHIKKAKRPTKTWAEIWTPVDKRIKSKVRHRAQHGSV